MLERNRIITVIIPAFGRPAQLLGAIESVRAQRIPPAHEVEILVVDDASTPAIKLGATYRDVKIVRLARNAGPAGARKAGIEASEGEFLAFLDSDDRWLPDKLWNQLALFEELDRRHDRSKLALACGFYYPDRRARLVESRIPRSASTLKDFVGGCWMCPGSTLFAHRSVFDRAGMPDSRLRRLEDFDWMLRFAACGGCLSVFPEPDVIVAPALGHSYQHVVNAAEIIRNKALGSNGLVKGWSQRGKMNSYLELEKADAALLECKRFTGVMHLLKSLVLAPRLRSAVEDFWDRNNEVPDRVSRIYEDMLADTRAAQSVHVSGFGTRVTD